MNSPQPIVASHNSLSRNVKHKRDRRGALRGNASHDRVTVNACGVGRNNLNSGTAPGTSQFLHPFMFRLSIAPRREKARVPSKVECGAYLISIWQFQTSSRHSGVKGSGSKCSDVLTPQITTQQALTPKSAPDSAHDVATMLLSALITAFEVDYRALCQALHFPP